jgi:UDP-N-acetylmuramate dehydrogenase
MPKAIRYDTNGLTTFGVVHRCEGVFFIEQSSEFLPVLRSVADPLIIGGGSNILFTQDLDRPIVVINHKGIRIINETSEYIEVEIDAGTEWHDLVIWAVNRNYGGIENLSLIPGKCGAAPMQNIGAYGVEVKDVFQSLSAYHVDSQEYITLEKSECELSYRDSIFKHELKNKVVINSITLKLSKDGYHQYNTSYGAIAEVLEENKIANPTIRDISNAVISIRQSKLPDPAVLPNAGSFFKNPVIPISQFEFLKNIYPAIPGYQTEHPNRIKVPAGWLIEKCGWKGKNIGLVGAYERQALVIINRGTNNGHEILTFARQVQSSVVKEFDILLDPEVNIY